MAEVKKEVRRIAAPKIARGRFMKERLSHS
jgi:hypothetical protein